MVLRVSLVLIVLLAVLAGLAPVRFELAADAALAAVIGQAGWMYLLIVFLTLAFLGYLAFGPFARLRIGGADAEPQFSGPTWLAMLFAAGMGIGLVFWGAAEPVSHLVNPPEGLPPDTPQAARAAMRYTFFHWGLHHWAFYALMGLAIARFQYNRSGRGLVSDLLQPLIGDRHLGWIGAVANVVAVVATAIGVATTLGFGTMQISAGMARVFGLPAGLGMQLAVIGVCFATFGGAALWGHIHGGLDMARPLAEGYETVLFAMYDSLPFTQLLSGLTILLLVIFFVTSADSAVLVLGSMSSEEPGDPGLARKFAWGIAIALVAAAMLVAGGLDALQTLITVVALPFALLMVGVMVGLQRVLRLEALRAEAQERRARKAIEAWIAREDGAGQGAPGP